MSGHAADLLAGRGDDSVFLGKPFHSDALAHAIRDLLDRRKAEEE